MKFSVFQVSRRGGRAKNEDRMGYSYTRDAAVLILADGMGGHPEGEMAAQIALSTIAERFQRDAQPALADVPYFLTEAMMLAHRQILRYGTDRGMLDCPRTTVVVAVVQQGLVTWTHCGDSRFYLVRSGNLVARTRDHSLLEQNLGRPPETRIQRRINRNVLFTCLGSPAKPLFRVEGALPLQQGDRLLLCSDGLWSNLPEDELLRQLCESNVATAVPEMVESALRAGGAACDNVTCLALEWETPDGFDTTRRSDMDPTRILSMDDESIERSIDEINAAIRRSMTRHR